MVALFSLISTSNNMVSFMYFYAGFMHLLFLASRWTYSQASARCRIETEWKICESNSAKFDIL